jgi:hypothetical protein
MSKQHGLTWRREGADRVLLARRRRFGRVVPDSRYPGMWRSTMSGGGLSGIANLAWSKNAVLLVAERELAYEAAITPRNTAEKRGVLSRRPHPFVKSDQPDPTHLNANQTIGEEL